MSARSRMTQITLTFALGSAAVVGGCKTEFDASPSPAMGDPYPAPLNDPQITVLAPDLRQVLGFQPTLVIKDDERPMRIEVPVRNLTWREYLIEYRVIFYDENDVQLEPLMSWEMVDLQPKQTVRLKRSAMSTEAETYRVEVKWSE